MLVTPHWASLITQPAHLNSDDSFASICCLSHVFKRKFYFIALHHQGFGWIDYFIFLDSIRGHHCPFYLFIYLFTYLFIYF